MALELDLSTMDPDMRREKKIAELERRVKDLERQRFAVPVQAGAPAAGDGGSGSLAGDSTSTRLWVKIGSTWRFVALT